MHMDRLACMILDIVQKLFVPMWLLQQDDVPEIHTGASLNPGPQLQPD